MKWFFTHAVMDQLNSPHMLPLFCVENLIIDGPRRTYLIRICQRDNFVF